MITYTDVYYYVYLCTYILYIRYLDKIIYVYTMDILLKRGYLIYIIMFVHVMEHIGCTRTHACYKNKL